MRHRIVKVLNPWINGDNLKGLVRKEEMGTFLMICATPSGAFWLWRQQEEVKVQNFLRGPWELGYSNLLLLMEDPDYIMHLSRNSGLYKPDFAVLASMLKCLFYEKGSSSVYCCSQLWEAISLLVAVERHFHIKQNLSPVRLTTVTFYNTNTCWESKHLTQRFLCTVDKELVDRQAWNCRAWLHEHPKAKS